MFGLSQGLRTATIPVVSLSASWTLQGSIASDLSCCGISFVPLADLKGFSLARHVGLDAGTLFLAW